GMAVLRDSVRCRRSQNGRCNKRGEVQVSEVFTHHTHPLGRLETPCHCLLSEAYIRTKREAPPLYIMKQAIVTAWQLTKRAVNVSINARNRRLAIEHVIRTKPKAHRIIHLEARVQVKQIVRWQAAVVSARGCKTIEELRFAAILGCRNMLPLERYRSRAPSVAEDAEQTILKG